MIPISPTRGSCASFGLLWLTDLHFGQRAHGWLWPSWEEEFFQDLSHVHKQSGPWDLILFTGDLVFSGKPEEYDGISILLGRLREFLTERQASLPLFFSVPGNHDVRRADPRSPVAASLRHYWTDEIVRETFWGEPDSEYRRFVEAAFEAYSGWSAANAFGIPPTFRTGLLPGDFSATIEKGAAKLGIVGLNTSFLQLEGGDYEGQLDLDLRQLQQACGGNAAAWQQHHHACLLITHHPIGWLAGGAQEMFRRAIYPTQRFAGHFHGHVHERSDLIVSHAGAQARRHFQGCSLFGLEHFGEAFEKDRAKFGYAAVRLELHRDTGSFYFWPRVGKEQQSGDFRLVPDTEATLIRGCEYYGPLEFPLSRPCEPADPRDGGVTRSGKASPAPKTPLPDPIVAPRTERAAIDRALSELDERRAVLPPGDYLRELGRLSAELAGIGERRRAWEILRGPFEREKRTLQRDERVGLGLKLIGLLLEDKQPDIAIRVLEPLLPEAEDLPGSDPRKAQFWQLQARCGIALSAYQDAVLALKRAIDITSDPDANSRLQAELAELHLLYGNIGEALIAARREGDES